MKQDNLYGQAFTGKVLTLNVFDLDALRSKFYNIFQAQRLAKTLVSIVSKEITSDLAIEIEDEDGTVTKKEWSDCTWQEKDAYRYRRASEIMASPNYKDETEILKFKDWRSLEHIATDTVNLSSDDAELLGNFILGILPPNDADNKATIFDRV